MASLQTRCLIPVVALILLGGPARMADAASLFTETFSSSLSGWTNAGSIAWQWNTNGYARVAFPATPIFQESILAGGASASSGAFTGDYKAADVAVIGFDFYAEDSEPNVLTLFLLSGTNSMSVALANRITETGAVHRLAVSLRDRASGPWLGPATDAQFDEWLASITAVRIRVTPKTNEAEAYRLDTLFLDRAPDTIALEIDSDGLPEMEWTHLRTNWTYRIEANTNLISGSWATLSTFSATEQSALFTDQDATNHPFRAYRLRFD